MIASIPSGILKYKVTRFLGVDRHVLVGNHAEYSFQNTVPFSLSGWFNWTSTSLMSVVNKLQNTSPFPGYDIFLQSGGAGFSLFGPGNAISVLTTRKDLADARWHHVCSTYNGGGLAAGTHVYVDGVDEPLDINSNNLAGSSLNASPFAFGVRPGPPGPVLFPFTGLLHDIAVYNKELSAAEVSAIHGSHCPPDLTEVGPVANLVGYWLAGEHRGDPDLTAGITSFPSVPDMSPSNRDGTMTNMAASAIETRK